MTSSAQARAKPFRPRVSSRLVAWACSIVAHLVLLYVAGGLNWDLLEPDAVRPPAVVWIERWPANQEAAVPPATADARARAASIPELPPQLSPEGAETDPAAETEARARAEQPPAAAEPRPGVDPRTAARELDVEPEAEAEAGAEAEAEAEADEPTAPSSEPSDGRSRNYIVRETDWDEELRRAAERTAAELSGEGGYLTFSLDDVIDKPLPQDEPSPARDVFEARSTGVGRRAVLSPGRSRSKFVNALSDLCHALTGGISIQGGLASVCAEANVPNDLFAHLKPAYLRSRPVCTQSAPADAGARDVLVAEVSAAGAAPASGSVPAPAPDLAASATDLARSAPDLAPSVTGLPPGTGTAVDVPAGLTAAAASSLDDAAIVPGGAAPADAAARSSVKCRLVVDDG